MKLQHYSNNAYSTVVLRDENDMIVGAWDGLARDRDRDWEGGTALSRYHQSRDADGWEENHSPWSPVPGVDTLVSEKRSGSAEIVKTDKQLLDESLLWLSAEHWLENWTYPENASTGCSQCACCREYLRKSKTTCTGCPISEYTGKTHCEGTHYYVANRALLSHRFGNVSNEEFRRHAEAMYTLLVELALSLGQGGIEDEN